MNRGVGRKGQRQRMNRMLAGLAHFGGGISIGVSVRHRFDRGTNISIRFPRHNVLESSHGRKREGA